MCWKGSVIGACGPDRGTVRADIGWVAEQRRRSRAATARKVTAPFTWDGIMTVSGDVLTADVKIGGLKVNPGGRGGHFRRLAGPLFDGDAVGEGDGTRLGDGVLMVDPSASFPPVAPPAQELVCDVYEADNSTLVGTITDAISAPGSMPLNDAAEATISVPRGSASAAMLTAGRVVRVKIWRSTRQMFVIGPRTLIAVASDRDRGEMLTVSGVSLLAHEWRRS